MKQPETREDMVKSEVIFAGFLAIGHEGSYQIKSNITGKVEAQALFERGQANLVSVDDAKSAVCVDGRCAHCSAADLSKNTDIHGEPGYDIPHEAVRQPVRPHVPGGTMHFATIMAIAGDAEIIKSAKTFNEAKERVTNHLEGLGYRDAIHTTTDAYLNPDGTDCGAIDKVIPATVDAVEENFEYNHSGLVKPVAETLSLIYGYEMPEEFVTKDNLYRGVIDSLETKMQTAFFQDYSPADNRDRLIQTAPDNVELLVSDLDHPTRLHEEQGIVINEIDGMTIDRDKNNGELFIYDRWFANNLARAISGTPLEHQRLLMAGDFMTVAIASKLVAPGMPVGIIKQPVSAYASA